MKCPLAMMLLVLPALALIRAPQQPPEHAPGLKLTIEPLASQPAGRADHRIARLIALAVPEGAAPSALVSAGPFRATWEGFINLKIRGDYSFIAHGSGEFELLINAEPVLKVSGHDLSTESSARVRLKKGANAIIARYSSPAKSQATIRLHWAERNQVPQPISPTVLTHDASDKQLVESLRIREGRELVVELRCIKCHQLSSLEHARDSMPELQMDAPALAGIGSRLRADWMARWINNPHSIRADATMPRIFRGNQPMDSRAVDIAAYLSSLADKHPIPAPVFEPNDTDAGARLFTGLGCIACHTLDREESQGRLSLSHLKEKWEPGALVDYVRHPALHYSWTRMPDFKLSEEEARKLAAFILSRSAEPGESAIDLKGANATLGRELVVASGCLNCHTLDAPSALRAPSFEQMIESGMTAGCLGDDQSAPAPQFVLSPTQRDAIRAFASRDTSALLRDTPAEFAARQIRLLNCVACHTLDSRQDLWSSLKEEIAAIETTLPLMDEHLVGDQSRPSLTWVGEKLRTGWMEEFIAGKDQPKPRPWLEARMPAFASRAKLLALGLAQQHGINPTDELEAHVDPNVAQIGRKLVGKEGGFACNTCHAVGSAAATAPFEAHGPNLKYSTSRMRKEFYHRWVGDPQRYEPGTRMPQYQDSRGKTALRDVFDANAREQFEAIWQYLRQGENIDPPDR